ncbi:MAG: N-acetylmannosamine-6-phosphate 2-epimerase [Cyanobacteria bacterium P01_D01_bin.6]
MAFDSQLAQLRQGLIVSCQAPADSPLHDPSVIAAMAEAAVNQGAIAVRIDSPAHITAVRKRVAVPIIGLWKQVRPDSEVYITPQFHHAQAVAAAGADVIAIDATERPRPGNTTLAELIQRIHTELQKPVMADIDTLASAQAAATAGADLLGTTLYGYTPATQHNQPPGLELLSTLVAKFSLPCICEGGIASPAVARKAMDLGASAVVVGTAITGIDSLVQRYQAALAASEGASSIKSRSF